MSRGIIRELIVTENLKKIYKRKTPFASHVFAHLDAASCDIKANCIDKIFDASIAPIDAGVKRPATGSEACTGG